MKEEIRRLVHTSRQYTPIVVGFFTVVILVALVIGAIMFFTKKAKK